MLLTLYTGITQLCSLRGLPRAFPDTRLKDFPFYSMVWLRATSRAQLSQPFVYSFVCSFVLSILDHFRLCWLLAEHPPHLPFLWAFTHPMHVCLSSVAPALFRVPEISSFTLGEKFRREREKFCTRLSPSLQRPRRFVSMVARMLNRAPAESTCISSMPGAFRKSNGYSELDHLVPSK